MARRHRSGASRSWRGRHPVRAVEVVARREDEGERGDGAPRRTCAGSRRPGRPIPSPQSPFTAKRTAGAAARRASPPPRPRARARRGRPPRRALSPAPGAVPGGLDALAQLVRAPAQALPRRVEGRLRGRRPGRPASPPAAAAAPAATGAAPPAGPAPAGGGREARAGADGTDHGGGPHAPSAHPDHLASGFRGHPSRPMARCYTHAPAGARSLPECPHVATFGGPGSPLTRS